MNILEETTGTYRVRIEGMTMRQIKDIFEEKWGALMWANGGAYPAEDVRLQFIKASRIEADEALMLQALFALEQADNLVTLDSVVVAITAMRKRLESSK